MKGKRRERNLSSRRGKVGWTIRECYVLETRKITSTRKEEKTRRKEKPRRDPRTRMRPPSEEGLVADYFLGKRKATRGWKRNGELEVTHLSEVPGARGDCKKKSHYKAI